jgi:L-seryl-tRNA(Ser) seleniumtransferase
MSRSTTDAQAALRLLPAIDEILRDERVTRLFERAPRDLVASFAARAIDEWRVAIKNGELSPRDVEARLERGDLVRAIAALVDREARRGVRRAINATGVVLNTGLGRAPVHREVAEAMAEVARSYCVLEVDCETGRRNQRDDRLGELLARLTGAEAGIGVNNNAGAVMLALQTFAGGRAAIVSRGELVEIGGSFRVPEVMARANAQLVEVGTTNRTRIGDYAAAITSDTGLLMKVHTSNFRVVGFVEEVSAREIAELGRERGIATAFDLGSGFVECDGAPPLAPLLGGEPLIRAAVESGVDCVTFSGDKLLGAPQAGLIVGKKRAIEALRKNPIYRALRLDKVSIAGLEKTCELLLAGRGAEIPARAMLAVSADALRPRAELIARRLVALGFRAEIAAGGSEPGSGSAPGVLLPTFVVRVTHSRLSADALAARLRAAEVPVFARVHDGALALDPRTLLPGDEDDLLRAFQAIANPEAIASAE